MNTFSNYRQGWTAAPLLAGLLLAGVLLVCDGRTGTPFGPASVTAATAPDRLEVKVWLLAKIDPAAVPNVPNLGRPAGQDLPAYALGGKTEVRVLAEFAAGVPDEAGLAWNGLVPDMFAPGNLMSFTLGMEEVALRRQADGALQLEMGRIGLEARRLEAAGVPGDVIFSKELASSASLKPGYRTLFHAPRQTGASYAISLLVALESPGVAVPAPPIPATLSLDDRVTLTSHGITMAGVLTRLGAILGKPARFSRRTELLERRVDLEVRESPIRNILDDLAGQHDFTYAVTDDHLEVRIP
jgi:hypothetical protein